MTTKGVARASGPDVERRALQRKVKHLETKVAARTEVRALDHSLKAELVHQRQFISDARLNANPSSPIERFYNLKGIHSSLGYHSPVEFERLAIA